MALPRPRPGADIAVARARVSRVRATRGDVTRWLEGVPLDALGLGPDEILYVPRLAIRLPGQEFGSAARMPERIAAELRALLAGARRGSGLGFVAGQPYRFTGRSRYHAWLVALWICDGSEAAREAFRAATGDDRLAPWQRRTVLRDGAALVSMVARLAEAGVAARWIARLEAGDIEQAFQAIEAAFGVRVDRLVREGAPLAPSPRPSARPTPPRRPSTQIGARLAAAGNDWRVLAPPARALLITAALVADTPARAIPDTATITAEIAALTAPTAIPAETALTPMAEHRAVQVRPPSRPPAAPAAEREEAAIPVPPRSAPTVQRPASKRGSPAPEAMSSAQVPPPAQPEAIAEDAALAAVTTPSAPAPARPAPPRYLAVPDQRFYTGHGGLLFLLNAFVALGLYPDFSRPLDARLAPSPLWLADRIGRYWFGRAYRRDPLAAWIAANVAPGRLPREWRPEPEWLTGFSTSGARFTLDGKRATIWSPAGFPLADGPAQRVARPPRMRLAIDPPRLPRAPGDRWAACLALYLDARLRAVAGSGLSDLALPAEIRTLDLDLRATFRLDCHPIALRIAGLDRDPGWQPAEGRSFAFVFA